MRWEAYAASALMEWRHEPKDTIPRNIFELGLKSHLAQPGLVLAYANFLLGEPPARLGGTAAAAACSHACGQRQGWPRPALLAQWQRFAAGFTEPCLRRAPVSCPDPRRPHTAWVCKTSSRLRLPGPHLPGLGDIPNTRALFERALTATPGEAAAPLWDAYVQLEYDVGSLAAAAAVEQRRAAAAAAAREAAAAAAAGAALDGKPAVHAEPAQHEALRLALLKYKVLDLWPGSAVQRLHFERLLGQAPAIEVGTGRD